MESKTLCRLRDNKKLFELLSNSYILYLPLKKKWYEMIYNGIKTEEYRDIKNYWTKRLKWKYTEFLDNSGETITTGYRRFDYVIFKNGYGKDSPIMVVELKKIWHSKGVKEWGADGINYYYTLYLGKILYKETV